MAAKKKAAKKAVAKKGAAKKAAPVKKAAVPVKKMAAPVKKVAAPAKKSKKAASAEPSIRMDINDRFRRWKDRSGISGSDIARGSGQTPAYISKVYSGNANLGLGLLVYLADEHKLSISWLLTGKGSETLGGATEPAKSGKKK